MHQLRLPLRCDIDLTYRCTNACRHCWILAPDAAAVRDREMSTAEWLRLVGDARALGCREWAISGGEPLLRPDFVEIFTHITEKALRYSLNTNGALITPELARVLRDRPNGRIMVALYGATAAMHEHVTGIPGSFEATLAGMCYLREAGTPFVAQLVPMRDSHAEYPAMIALAQTYTPLYRVGAPWLYLSASGHPGRNAEICRQRLDPADIAHLTLDGQQPGDAMAPPTGGNTFHNCITGRQGFHLDPYGTMSFCNRVVDPALRYDARAGSFREGWEVFLPALAERLAVLPAKPAQCEGCASRAWCDWCPLYSYLESRDYTGLVPYMCEIAHAKRATAEVQSQAHTRYYTLGGLTVHLISDVPITERTIQSNYVPFQVDGPGDDMVTLHHHFTLPDLAGKDLGPCVYSNGVTFLHRPPGRWIYVQRDEERPEIVQAIAEYSDDHTRGDIYYAPECAAEFQAGTPLLTGFVLDQAIFGRVFADRQACYLHCSGFIMGGQGLLFLGHSGAGKTTTLRMLEGLGTITSDDRNIVRRWPDGFRMHGTWLHGDITEVSPADAPLRALCFIEQAPENRLIRLDPQEALRHLLFRVIKPYACAEWWDKTLTLLGQLSREVPAYRLRLDTSGAVRELMTELVDAQPEGVR